jgi:acyl transferase domain-containing protein/acyl carrier protein/nucleoside-diphosphate-sugar epimerase
MMRPVWDALMLKDFAVFPSAASRLTIVGGTDSQKQAIRQQYKNAIDLAIAPGQGIQAITELLRQPERLDHIVWIAPESKLQAVTDEQIINAQHDGVMQLFRLVKALPALGYAAADLGLTVITTQALAVCDVDRVNPIHAAVHGLVGSIAKEYPKWQLRALDVAAEANWPVPEMWRLPPHPQGESYAWRGQGWLQQKLVPLRDAAVSTDVYRHRGVYVVIGGAGGLGETWSKAMIRDYQAGIIWLGRTGKNAAIQAKLDALAEYGAVPEYIQADARDPEAMQQAYRQIKQRHGNIHGLIVSTLGEYDQSLAQMSEDLFRDILSVKLDVNVRAVQLFQDEPLDFVVFFSSMVAFGRSGGMSAYASACTFNDAFARQLAHEWACAVKVVNWGYWDVGGGTRISGALKNLVEQRGVQPIDAAQGLAALKTLLGAPIPQLAVTRTSKPELIETFAGDEWMACVADKSRSCMDSIEAYRPIQAAPEENPSTGQLNDWIVKLLFVQLQAMGLFQPGHWDDPEAMRKRAGILDKYDRWWRESLNILQQQGYVRIDGGCFMSDESAGCEPQQQVWQEWKTQKQHYLNQPETRTLAVLVDDCLSQLPEVLRGTTPVTDVLFPNGSMDKIEGLYKNNRVCDYFNDVVAGVAETYIRQRINDDPAARIRIIEIGAGTGGTTSTVLPHLNPLRQYIDEYCYTDMSRSFFIHAKQRYGTEYPYLTYKLCNIEQPLTAQDIAVGSYDIAIATNVLHATRSMRNTLRNAKAALKNNGIVILNEISDKTVFASVLFGLIDGWSLAEDDHLRIPGSPGLFPESWRTLLHQEGFRSVLFPAEADHALGQQIIVADSDGLIRQQVGDQGRMQKQSAQAETVAEPVTAQTQIDLTETETKQDAAEAVQSLILDSLATALSIGRDMIELDVPFSDYGIDSILGVGFIQQLNTELSLSMNTTILFDYATVERLRGHIIADNRHSIRLEAKPAAIPAQAPTTLHCVLTQKIEPEPAQQRPNRLDTDGIAVIGMSGQFPGAKNVDEFWHNMISGVDPVTELPEHYLGESRYSPEKQPGKSYCKWGGVLEGRDCFDPMFFNISPREAESMNPHQRLILQESWKALEDAGYNPKSLSDSRTGIFVGSEPTGYVHETFTGASEAIVASRLSYFLNLRGPAFVVNTGCSSSGVALHQACESLRNHESDLALSGGVFAVMGQTILVGLAQTDMLTHKGRCYAFDADADGMVMSEGVGMVALKRLDQALADGDAIYGVIRGSGINQDGASNGITAPNGIAQQQLIADVYRRYNIDPERISYIETHGTGTQLGDPIEANALARAFREFTDKTHYCAIGSAKSHIGHTSSNSGVTGLISLLLSLKHHKLPGLRHFKKLNPLIDFEQSAFYPCTQQSEWRSSDGKPLMAAMNSFGHGGTNAHLVVEEFVGGNAEPGHSDSAGPELIVLSAKDEARLMDMASNLNDFVLQAIRYSAEGQFSDEVVTLADIAYTLQTGREAMEQRAAFTVHSLIELTGLLAAFLTDNAGGSPLWTGYVEPKRNKKERNQYATEISRWLADSALDKLAASWVQGAEIDWSNLRRESKPRRIHLPAYPFARERYWRPNEVFGTLSGPEHEVYENLHLHPLVQRNTSTLYQQRFQSIFTGAEFFLSDHIVQGQKLLPGVAYLEMARAAIGHALGREPQFHALRLNNIIWTKPLAVTDGAVDVAISLNAEANGSIGYRISSGQAQLHNQGVAFTEAPKTPEPLDLSALRAGIDQSGVTVDLCYAALASAGVCYGPAQKAMHTVYTGPNQVLAKLQLPDIIADTSELYVLHPAIMDAALQASIALALADGGSGQRPVLLPFALESLEIFAPCQPVMWTWIRASATPAAGDDLHKLDIDLCTEQGEVCVRMLGFTSRVLSGDRIAAVDGEDTGRAVSHPLLHSQDADGQRFVTRFSGNEFFLRDHSGMLPGAVYLEMARAAAVHCGDGSIFGLSHIVWPKPMLVNEQGSGLITRLTPDGFSIVTRNNDGESIHCQGKIIMGRAAPKTGAEFDIEAIQSRCASLLNREQCDRLLDSTHGPALLSIDHLRYNDQEALARLELPDELKSGQADYLLHPSLLNGAILTGVVWTLTERPGAALPMPFSLDQLRIYRPFPQQLYASVRRNGDVGQSGNLESVDIDLLDSRGQLLASLKKFTTVFAQQADELVFATPEWRDQPLPEPVQPMRAAAPVFILAERQDALHKALQAKWPEAHIEIMSALGEGLAAGIEHCFLQLFTCCHQVINEKSGAIRPLLLLIPHTEQAVLYGGLSGLLKTVRLEHPRVAAKTVAYQLADDAAITRFVSRLAAEIDSPRGDVDIRYNSDGQRQARILTEVSLPDSAAQTPVFKPGDLIWITGGLGGVGRLLARYLGVDRKARLVLSGRSALDADSEQFINALKRQGAELIYLQADIAQTESVGEALKRIEQRYGRLNGIIHSAGVIEDDYIVNKTDAQIARVLRPKIAGIVALDAATRHLPLDYMVLFSSIAGALGNPGQADYAGANAFLDGFAEYRNNQARQGKRAGKTLSLNWPLWRDGGMQMGRQNEVLMRQATGMAAMATESGLRALEQGLSGDYAQLLVAYGDKAGIRIKLLAFKYDAVETGPSVDQPYNDSLQQKLTQSVSAELIRIVAEVQRIRPEKITLSRDLSAYGFDSISFTEFANTLNKVYALSLMPTLFFEIPDLAALAAYLVRHHQQALLNKYGVDRPQPVAEPVPVAQPGRFRLQEAAPAASSVPVVDTDAIAVIGIGGKFPGSTDLDDFWRQLQANRDLITEVPKQRWDWREIYGDPHQQPGKTKVKWGGFIADADCFDARFFGISPVEAEALDPQFRLFLETVWATLEDAGYPAGALAGSKTGVFAGVATADYKDLWCEARLKGTIRSLTEPFPFMIANRVSYWFNFHGPSEVIDTACSSSLIAVNRAIESIRQGNCDMALAGGVNVLGSPRLTIASSQAGMLSEDGRCMTFDQRANGYVRSEGVAVLLLKPLHKAIADNDRIYGLIRGSGENHGGRSASPTAPNAAAQKQLLVDVYSRAGIDPRTVGYIEAHGTGTVLGDPVEVNGLKAAFAELYQRRGLSAPAQAYCGLNSVKANVGHLEAASGAAGIIKVLLMLKHRQIPGNPHLHTPNPYLQLDGTPFYLARETRDWEQQTDQNRNPLPRRAGVSSFGVGGSNAHVIIEEYPVNAGQCSEPVSGASPVLIVLSAKNEQRLRDYADKLLQFIRNEREAVNLRDMAYTLQVGREAMPQRLAFQAASFDELEQKLQAFIDQPTPVEGVHRGQVRQTDDGMTEFSADEDMVATFDAWIEKGKYDKLSAAWVNGLEFDWLKLYSGGKPARIGLPTYPFVRERYWIPAGEAATENGDNQTQPAEPGAKAEQAEDLLIFEEVWSESPLTKAPADSIKTLLCFVSGQQHQQAIIEQVQQLEAQTRIVFVEQGIGAAQVSDTRYRIDADNAGSYAQTFNMIRDAAIEVDAILYLWPLEDPRSVKDASRVLHLLQAMAGAGLKPRKLILSGAYADALERCYLDAWIAFERSLGLVLPDTQVAVVFREAESRSVAMQEWLQKLWAELQAAQLRSACYRQQTRYAAQVQPVDLQPYGDSLLKQRGTYLITGGCGGLGMIFAEHLARNYAAKLVLTGRSAPDAKKRNNLQRLEGYGAHVLYVQADVADPEAMQAGIEQAVQRFGDINGVLHIAGISGAATLLETNPADFQRVLDAKMAGTQVLDSVLAKQTPDFICYFSSSSAILGDFGSCDYALGNRFQTAYAHYRNSRYPGKTIVINWPLWRDGGLQVGDGEQTRFYLKFRGQRSLQSNEGVRLFEQLLAQDKNQFLVLAGQAERLQRVIDLNPVRTKPVPANAAVAASGKRAGMKGLSIEQCINLDLKEQICNLLKTQPNELDADSNLADFGFDSISLAEFSRALSRHYSLEITPSVFFSYATLRKLTAYFFTEHRQAMQAFYREPDAEAPPAVIETVAKPVSQQALAPAYQPETDINEPIAIIGISGRFPKARNVDELWQILEQGEDAVDEIPSDRFDWRQYYGDSANNSEKTNSKWCGCIPGIAEFDPLFFEISPLEAERMDPRQRHLLQESWLALENAGYGPEQIVRYKIGMFVGVEDGSDYQRRLKQVSLTSTHNGILASRLAYFLNLKGPIMAINTACSSSLVAAHQACLSLRQNECDTAIAAGVNLMVSPAAYVGMTQAGMLSPDGKCYVFDQRANGMVPGEAVAVVVLKRLSRALADGDPIHGVIRGSGINYDGKTNGITAPSGASQTELLVDVYQKARLQAEDIDYIITHGTATQLGDPVEINALYDAFKGSTDKQGFCALTSTKSNFGHTFAASGLVSLISLVQALKYETIPASLHCEQENDYIRWRESPFYVNKRKKAWTKQPGQLRTGAVSAFGMSGTNAHMVVQNHVAEPALTATSAPYYLLAVSAKTEAALQEQIRQMIAYLQQPESGLQGLDSISYTLQQGRHHFQHRCAIVVSDVQHALETWSRSVNREAGADCCRGVVSREFTGQKAISRYINDLCRQGQGLLNKADEYREMLLALADFYCQGYDIPWQDLYPAAPRRISLPGYPFAREHYWIDEQPEPTVEVEAPEARLHPLVHRNISSLQKQQFAATFTGDESYMIRYRQAEQQFIPALFYPEMARFAAEQATAQPVAGLKNMVWGTPLVYQKGSTQILTVSLHKKDGDILYAIGIEGQQDFNHFGEVVTGSSAIQLLEPVDLSRLRAGLQRTEPNGLSADQTAASITDVYASGTELMATLNLPANANDQIRSMLFQPLFINAAWRLLQVFDRNGAVLLPFSLQRIAASRSLPDRLVLHLVRKGGTIEHQQKYDMTFYDANGKACLHLQELTVTTQDRLFNISI